MAASRFSVRETVDEVILTVLLNCEHTKSSETKQVLFNSLPTTPLEIKKKIEEDFSIPSCVQTLHYQSMILKDSDHLQHKCIHFRSGDTFTVDYPIEAECKLVQNIIKWLKELLKLLKFIEEVILCPYKKDDHLMASKINELGSLILEGENDDTVRALCESLFSPWEDKRKLTNCVYFQQEGGLDALMKIYGVFVNFEWGDIGLSKDLHCFLEHVCSFVLFSYAQTFPLRRQVVKLGGLEMRMKTLMRRKLRGCKDVPDNIFNILHSALIALSNLSELPECQVPLAMRTDVINQVLVMAMQDSRTAITSLTILVCLTHSPETHPYFARKDVVKKMLEICKQKHKTTNVQSQQAQEDPMMTNALKYYTSIVLAQIGLGSSHLMFDGDYIPPHLLHQVSKLMSEMLEAASPAEMHQYEDKEGLVWNTFLPSLHYLYKPSTVAGDSDDIRTALYITCCSVLLYRVEVTLGSDRNLDFLLTEGLLDYTMCLPAVLPGECQPRAMSLVNELGKHRQLQPPSLCTLAKAHIAKEFCGLQPVMEMKSIGEFLHNFD